MNMIDKAKEQLECAVEIQRCILAELYSETNKLESTNHNRTQVSKTTVNLANDDRIYQKARKVKLEVAYIQCNLGCILLDVVISTEKWKKRKERKNLK